MRLLLGTESELKRQAIVEVLKLYSQNTSFELTTEEVSSKVPHTPHNQQTYLGAKNRARVLYQRYQQNYTLYVGIESGLVEREEKLFEECWCVIYDQKGKEYTGYSSGFMLPQKIVKRLEKGYAC